MVGLLRPESHSAYLELARATAARTKPSFQCQLPERFTIVLWFRSGTRFGFREPAAP
jgi:hypothetical protein